MAWQRRSAMASALAAATLGAAPARAEELPVRGHRHGQPHGHLLSRRLVDRERAVEPARGQALRRRRRLRGAEPHPGGGDLQGLRGQRRGDLGRPDRHRLRPERRGLRRVLGHRRLRRERADGQPARLGQPVRRKRASGGDRHLRDQAGGRSARPAGVARRRRLRHTDRRACRARGVRPGTFRPHGGPRPARTGRST